MSVYLYWELLKTRFSSLRGGVADKAIQQNHCVKKSGLLRFARNDGFLEVPYCHSREGGNPVLVCGMLTAYRAGYQIAQFLRKTLQVLEKLASGMTLHEG